MVKCFFLLVFFLSFLLLLHFLHQGSIQLVVCPVWSFFEVQLYCGINISHWKCRDSLVTARGYFYEKILAGPSVGENTVISVFRAKKKEPEIANVLIIIVWKDHNATKIWIADIIRFLESAPFNSFPSCTPFQLVFSLQYMTTNQTYCLPMSQSMGMIYC